MKKFILFLCLFGTILITLSSCNYERKMKPAKLIEVSTYTETYTFYDCGYYIKSKSHIVIWFDYKTSFNYDPNNYVEFYNVNFCIKKE